MKAVLVYILYWYKAGVGGTIEWNSLVCCPYCGCKGIRAVKLFLNREY